MAVPRPRTQIHPIMHPPQTLSPPRLPPLETDRRGDPQKGNSYTLKLAPCGRTVLVDLVPDSPPMRTGHDGQRICDERLGLTSAVLPAWAVSWALTTPHHLCLLAGYVVAGHNVPA